MTFSEKINHFIASCRAAVLRGELGDYPIMEAEKILSATERALEVIAENRISGRPSTLEQISDLEKTLGPLTELADVYDRGR